MHHIHIGSIPITNPAKQIIAIPTSKLKTSEKTILQAEFGKSNFAETSKAG
jgi:hypothetical protein